MDSRGWQSDDLCREGNRLLNAGRVSDAINVYRAALSIRPDYAEVYANLGHALLQAGDVDEALTACGQAVALRPNLAVAQINLGNALLAKRDLTEAIKVYSRALELAPNSAEGFYNLGNALRDVGRFDETIDAYQKAIEIRRDFAPAHNNMATMLMELGRVDEALACYDRAISILPNHAALHGGRLYAMHFHPDYDAKAIMEAHQEWYRRHAQKLENEIRTHGNDRNPDRRLRIGYVSPDLRSHAVGCFLIPLFENHDRDRFEIYCYSSTLITDDVTQRLRGCVQVWRDVRGMSDAQVAGRIAEDGIDILVDLTLHMAGNRMLAFARKPAPVQVTYLAYCSTSGMPTMDYRLTDPHLDPPGSDESCYSEESIRIADSYWCYQPWANAPEAGELPAQRSGRVTFGCLNNYAKVSKQTWETWSRILREVPGSRLIVHGPGSDVEGVTFVPKMPTGDYFKTYQQIDIALDPFPYGGGTTTCDALWMGVPVVKLQGQTAVGRGGTSILSNLELCGLIAHNPEQYVAIAKDLAGDLPRLAKMRGELRERMKGSPLMDGARLARNVENAYRQMWGRWCAKAIS
jgi:protein O-GlcNAc transferase